MLSSCHFVVIWGKSPEGLRTLALSEDDKASGPRLRSGGVPGRKRKTEAFRFRAASYYYAIAHEAELEFGPPITPAGLRDLFLEEVGGKKSTVWYEYRAGRNMPERGTYKVKDTRLSGAIDARFPRTIAWRDHPIWTLIDRVELTEKNIHALMLDLPIAVSIMLIVKLGDKGYSRCYSNPRLEVGSLVSRGTIDDFAGVIALIREAELRQELDRYEIAQAGMLQMFPVLYRTPAIRPLAADLESYLRETFKYMWYIIPGLYAERP